MAKQFYADWEGATEWADEGFTIIPADFEAFYIESSDPIEKTQSGGQEYHGAATPPAFTAGYVDGFDESIISVRGVIRFDTLAATQDAGDATDVDNLFQNIPWALRTSGDADVLSGRLWRESGGQWHVTWYLKSGTVESFGLDYEVSQGETYSYRIDLSTTDELTKAFVYWRNDTSGRTFESIVAIDTPTANVDKIVFFISPGDNLKTTNNDIELAHDVLDVRSGGNFVAIYHDVDVYLAIKEAEEKLGPSGRAQVIYASQDLLKAEYEYRRFGGCGKGRFVVHAPSMRDGKYQGKAIRNDMWFNLLTHWGTATSGSGSVGFQGAAAAYADWQQPWMQAPDPTADAAAIYQDLLGGLRTRTKHRVRFIYKDRAGNANSFPAVVRIQNLTAGLEWSISQGLWVATSGFSLNDNRFASVSDWTKVNIEFHTDDNRLNPGDSYRVRMQTINAPANQADYGIGLCQVQAWQGSELHDRLTTLDNLGSLEIFARHELGTEAAHPYDGRNSEFRRIYSGFITGINEDTRMESITIDTQGWSQMVRDRVISALPYENLSIGAIVSAIIAPLVDATDGPFLTSSVGEAGNDPTDRILESIDLDGKSVNSALDDLGDLVPGEVAWGVDADRQFFFKGIPRSFDPVAAPDPENTIYSIDVDSEGKTWRRKIDLSRVFSKIRILGKRAEDDEGNETGPRATAEVENTRASSRFSLRQKDFIRDGIENVNELGRTAQLRAAELSHPRHKSQLRFGPTRFFAGLERLQTIRPIMVRDGTRKGFRFGSDGNVFVSGTAPGASVEFDGVDGSLSFTCGQTVGTSGGGGVGDYVIHFKAAMPDITTGNNYVAISNGQSGTNPKFLKLEFSKVGANQVLTAYAGTVSAPNAWTAIAQKTFTGTPHLGTTRWAVYKGPGTAGLVLFVDAAQVAWTASSPFGHGNVSELTWYIGSDLGSADYFKGKLDDMVCFEYPLSYSFVNTDLHGVGRFPRSYGELMAWWLMFDENSSSMYWRGPKSGDPTTTQYGLITQSGGVSFSNALDLLSGTGVRWGGNHVYGSYPLLIVERLRRRWMSRNGWDTTLDLGNILPDVGTTMEELNRQIDRLSEVIK